jgi:CheY-like chemotaxis protein
VARRLKVVLMTGYSELVQGRTSVELGIDKLLPKPFTLDELGRTLREALDAEPGAR